LRGEAKQFGDRAHEKLQILKIQDGTAAILKIVKSQNCNEKLSDFDEILYTTADGSHA